MLSQDQVQIIIGAKNQTEAAFKGVEAGLKRLTGTFTSLSIQFAAVQYAATKAFDMIAAAIKPAYDAVESYNLSVAKTAAMITNFQGNGNFAENYKQAKEYAQDLIPVLEQIDAKTIASAGDLQLMTEEMLKQRIVLDTTNQKQLDAFTNLANAAAVVSQGYPAKEVQIRQEIRSMLQGELKATNQLAQQLDAMLNGSLKESLATWRKEGTVIEHIGELLQGYAEASDDLSGTWAVIGSTMETIKNKILRDGFSPAYKEINAALQKMNDWLKTNSATLSSIVGRAYLTVKGVLETLWKLSEPFMPLLSELWKLVENIAEGLGLIAYVILPPLAERLGKVLQSMFDLVLAAGNLGSAFYKLMKLDFSGAYEEAKNAKANWYKAGEDIGAAFSGGLIDEFEMRYSIWQKTGLKLDGSGKSKVPKLSPPGPTEEDQKAAKKKAEEEQKRMIKQVAGSFGEIPEDSWARRYDSPKDLAKTRREVYQAMEQFRKKQYLDEVTKSQQEFEQAKTALTPMEEYMLGGQNEAAISRMQQQRTEWENTNKYMVELSQRTAEAMEQNFSNLFFDTMTGKFRDLGDYINGVLESISRAISDMLGQMMRVGLFGADNKSGLIGSLISGIGGGMVQVPRHHSGGVIGQASGSGHGLLPAFALSVAPRLHMGLAPDEFPAILQRGETVIPKGQGGQSVNVKVNVVNNTGQQAQVRQDPPRWDGQEWVVGIWLDAFERNSFGLRDMLGGA